ncbi:Bifunctional purine biosynthetic protein ade1, partial [Dispira parvispora]
MATIQQFNRRFAHSLTLTTPRVTGVRSVHTTRTVQARVSKRRQEIQAAIRQEKERQAQEAEEERRRLDTPFLNAVLKPKELYEQAAAKASQGEAQPSSQESPLLVSSLDQKDERFILDTIPSTKAAHGKVVAEEEQERSREGAQQLHKVMALHNAGSKEILKWNKQLAVRTFGREQNDTGSSEVQAAIWTLRINNLHEHLLKNPKDKYNCRRYIMLQHKRAKILRYLKRCSLERYARCLKLLGLKPEMVEEQIKPISRVVAYECPELQLLSRGKVRDLYQVTNDTLLFVATDRISAYDVVMNTGIPGKGKILTQLSVFWFKLLEDVVPNHLITANMDEMPPQVQKYRDQLEGRSLLVKKASIFPVEAIVRGYISGSGWKEYCAKQTVCDIPLPAGLEESEKLSQPLFTPSTKAELGEHDENIHPSQVATLIGQDYAQQMEKAALALYNRAHAF